MRHLELISKYFTYTLIARIDIPCANFTPVVDKPVLLYLYEFRTSLV